MTEIGLGLMQLLNDSCFHVTAEVNHLASGMRRVFRAVTCLLQYDFHIEIRDPAVMEMPVLVTHFSCWRSCKNASYFSNGTLLFCLFKIRLLLM